MAETEQAKVCKRCAETIKTAAKVCPYCRTPQSRCFFITEHEACAIAALILFAGCVVLALWMFDTGREYSPKRHKISVVSSQFGIEANKNQTNVVVSGILTNASEYKWNIMQLEIRFLDGTGKMVDAETASTYGDLFVLSHSEASFHLVLSKKELPIFSNSQVTVTKATDPEVWFNH